MEFARKLRPVTLLDGKTLYVTAEQAREMKYDLAAEALILLIRYQPAEMLLLTIWGFGIAALVDRTQSLG